MQLWDYIKAELAVLKQAPVSFVGLVVISIAAGVGIGTWHYSERLDAQDSQIKRYRVALGIDSASKGALVELNNEELALRAQSIVAKLREFNSRLDARIEAVQKLNEASKVGKEQAFKDQQAVMQQVSQEFDSNLASDAYNVDSELQKRLSPEATAHIIRVPSLTSDSGGHIAITALLRGTGFDALFIRTLADEIEQMAKLLPSDSPIK